MNSRSPISSYLGIATARRQTTKSEAHSDTIEAKDVVTPHDKKILAFKMYMKVGDGFRMTKRMEPSFSMEGRP
jgi:hypothetical protein